jgi:phage terminase small subunit
VAKGKSLTEKQRRYVEHRVAGMQPYAAARAMGLTHNSAKQIAKRLEVHPEVRAAILKEQDAYEQASGMTKQRVIDGFLEGIQMARMMAEPATMIAGWREIGRMCGYYMDEKKTDARTLPPAAEALLSRFATMSERELLLLANSVSAKVIEAEPS